MTKTTLSQNLVDSFSNLRKTARSDDDVAKWFIDNPAAIPNMPEAFRPFVKVRFTDSRLMMDSNFEEVTIISWVDIHIEAKVPCSLENTINDILFEEQTGQLINIQRDRVDTAAYRGEFSLGAKWKDWAYIAAKSAISSLNMGVHPDRGLWCETAAEAWAIQFPNLSWDNLVNLYESDLVPLSHEKFIDWAMTTNNKPGLAANLPGDMTL